MKKLLAFKAITFLCFLSPIYGQWEKTIIDDNINLAVSVDCADLNNDNKPDLVVTNFGGGEIIFYQNNYADWKRHVISTDKATFAFTGDVDGDSIPDIIACIPKVAGPDEIVWYKNNHPSWTRHIIDDDADNPDYMLVADINNDNIPEVIAGGDILVGGALVWYEKSYPKWRRHIIDEPPNTGISFEIIDMDGDGLLDIVTAMNDANNLAWYKNEDLGLTWTKNLIDDDCRNAWVAGVGDIDGDLDLDVAVTDGGPYQNGSHIYLYENTGSEWAKSVLDNDFPGANSVSIIDIDGDDKRDIVVGGYSANQLVWYKNSYPRWNNRVPIDRNMEGPRMFTFEDVNGDDQDELIVAGLNSIALYLKPSFTGIGSAFIEDLPFDIYPNPASGIINITGLTQPSEAKIYSIQGKLIKSEHQIINALDISDLPSGVYFLNLTSGDTVLKKTIVKR